MKATHLFALILILICLVTTTKAQNSVVKTSHTVMLGETPVNINVYEKRGSKVTFFAPHHNEQTSLRIAKEYVEKYGGRVVEVQSFDERGFASRYIKFNFSGKNYTLDPNRIFTENGRSCNYPSPDLNLIVKLFSENILKILFKADGKTLRDGEMLIVAVHNNSDVDAKNPSARSTDLTAVSFFRGDNTERFSQGAFADQADGVFLSNMEADTDNFVFLSSLTYLRFFVEKGFNVIVQRPPSKLQLIKCSGDDGSLSVYSGQQNIPYVCLEADGTDGGYRQRLMFEAVYQLLKLTESSKAAITGKQP